MTTRADDPSMPNVPPLVIVVRDIDTGVRVTVRPSARKISRPSAKAGKA